MTYPGTIRRKTFQFGPIQSRVLFGSGTRKSLEEELATAGLSRIMVLTTPGRAVLADEVRSLAGSRVAGVFNGAAMHTPVEVTDKALRELETLKADGILAIGGGSTIGLGKALAARTGLPQTVLPTTYSGSEMTPILGETKDGIKTTRSGPEILPGTVIYDVELTHGLPVATSVTSGINAIAHGIEALYAVNGNPVVDTLALEGISALVKALPDIVEDQASDTGRENALYGAWLCGICLGSVGMALHHKLCHVLGGSFGLPHAETHTVVLPHALAYNAPAIPAVIERLQPVLGTDPARGLQDFARRLGAPKSLAEIGMPQDGIDKATELALKARYPNPRPLEAEAIRSTLNRAWSGGPA
ncbi:maleylacetate reductase [Stappia aggregata IAM 12614]|uniref:Maleylacetate reductase n=1 Tax=Roseibium aggregatum (strain ATCC 25650 / DSM 13394 / JCM 20685 / NBRC 16684 / NCIMB 2208 / IAM 12614 / B1) TaxID=384765 RepID=A0P0G7_ROSAI|nr:maleylacetate reductase [Roseibium aggregatum]EAV41575.1 maleylacetate reductase [Stappia aggregata IAM 12614] [Roseibium aggregatum IAM 12614]